MNQKDSRHVLLPLSNSLKNTGKSAHCRYGNELNQTDCIAHQPDSGYHPRAYVWDHIHIRRSGLIVQKGGSISGPLFFVFVISVIPVKQPFRVLPVRVLSAVPTHHPHTIRDGVNQRENPAEILRR